LDVDELRSIFSLSASAAEKIRLFRIDRVAKIVADEAPTSLPAQAKMVTHIVPLSAFTTNDLINLDHLWRDPTLFFSINNQSGLSRFNADGVIVESLPRQACLVARLMSLTETRYLYPR
jgi:hypothetical protein